jgi:hypothetical protein
MRERLMIAAKSDQSHLPSAPEECFNIAATPRYMQDEDVLAFDTVNNDVFPAGKASQTRTKVLVSASSKIGVAGEKKKPVGYGINKAVGNSDAAAFSRDVIPNVIEFGFDFRGKTVRH